MLLLLILSYKSQNRTTFLNFPNYPRTSGNMISISGEGEVEIKRTDQKRGKYQYTSSRKDEDQHQSVLSCKRQVNLQASANVSKVSLNGRSCICYCKVSKGMAELHSQLTNNGNGNL